MMTILLVVTLGFSMAKGLEGDGIATSVVALCLLSDRRFLYPYP